MNTSPPDQPALDNQMTDDHITALTRAWLEEAVIGLNLCPFAEPVHRNGQIAYYVSHAKDAPALMDDLSEAIDSLMNADPEEIDTNRSPFPMLHLLREASVDAALTELPEAAQLVEKNLDTLRDLGADGWNALTQRIHALAKPTQ